MHAMQLERHDIPLTVPMEVVDAFGTRVVDAGSELTPAVMEEICGRGTFAGTCRVSLKGSRLRKDMEGLIQKGPLFPRLFLPGRLEAILTLYDNLRVLPVLFEEFELMRSRSAYVYQHTLRTAALTASLAMDLYGADKAPLIGYTALTHDLGMARLPDDILHQDIGPDRQKRRLLYGHTVAGFALLSYYLGSTQYGNCRAALEHHERGKGVGYPRGIDLNDSVIEILSVADALDALLSARPFRKEPFELRAALDLLWNQAKAGTLNPVAVKLLIAYSRKKPFNPAEFTVSEKLRDRSSPENRYLDWPTYQQRECCSPDRDR